MSCYDFLSLESSCSLFLLVVFPCGQQSICRALSLLLTLVWNVFTAETSDDLSLCSCLWYHFQFMLPSLCLHSQLWFRDTRSDLHLGQLWMWPDPKTCDWGHCYCAPEIEWPLSCTDSKGPGAKGNNDGLRPFSLVLESAESGAG